MVPMMNLALTTTPFPHITKLLPLTYVTIFNKPTIPPFWYLLAYLTQMLTQKIRLRPCLACRDIKLLQLPPALVSTLHTWSSLLQRKGPAWASPQQHRHFLLGSLMPGPRPTRPSRFFRLKTSLTYLRP